MMMLMMIIAVTQTIFKIEPPNFAWKYRQIIPKFMMIMIMKMTIMLMMIMTMMIIAVTQIKSKPDSPFLIDSDIVISLYKSTNQVIIRFMDINSQREVREA